MSEVYFCFDPGERQVAEAIGARFERAGLTVAVDDSGEENVVQKWEAGLSSAAILLLLSPRSVPPRPARAEWGALLNHAASGTAPPVISLLVTGCQYPNLLERRNFYRWQGREIETLRELERRVLRLDPTPEESFVLARSPWFEGREPEFETLWETLVDSAGAVAVVNPDPGSGKTALAQEFARRAAGHFRRTVWIAAGGRSSVSIEADLAERLGDACPDDAGERLHGLLRAAGKRRLLLVLDDLPAGIRLPADARGNSSILVTARTFDDAPPGVRVLEIGNGPEVEAAPPHDAACLNLWRAMSICHPGGFPVDFAARVAAVAPADLPELCSRLIGSRLVDPIDETGSWMRLGAVPRGFAPESLEQERRRHAEAALETLSARSFEKRAIPEIMPAFRWASRNDWALASNLARHAFGALRGCGRLAEGAELLIALRDAADARGDWQASDFCAWELSWIRGVPYRGSPRAPAEADQLSLDFGP